MLSLALELETDVAGDVAVEVVQVAGPDAPGLARGVEREAVWGKQQAADLRCAQLDGAEQVACAKIPEADRTVGGGGREDFLVGAESDAGWCLRVTLE